MTATRVARAVGWMLLGLVVLVALVVLLFDPNWLRGPIMRQTTEKTGRELVIEGDLGIDWGWPVTRLSAAGISFANPEWAEEDQMLRAENITVGVSLPQLLRRNLMLPEIDLDTVDVFLERHPDGRRNWLLDREQKDEGARLEIGTLSLHDGHIRYFEPAQDTRIDAKVSTSDVDGEAGARPDARGAATAEDNGRVARSAGDAGIRFDAKGRYKGMAMQARGSGGPALALRDETTPYPLDIEARFGRTRVKADGSITSLLKFSAIDLDVDLRGASLARLFPLIGIALPETPEYRTAGHLVRDGKTWRYEEFSGAIGNSEVGGTLQVDTDGERPYLHGALTFKKLDFADLGPVVGATGDTEAAGDAPAEAGGKVLPQTPFRTDRWNTVDADVTLKAGTIRRPEELPIDNLDTRLQLRDSVLTLDPLKFGFAGGTLAGTIRLDGKSEPLNASLKLGVRQLKLAELFPTLDESKSSIGELNGEFDLKGNGNTVAAMLGSADGEAALIVADGQVSRFLMEAIGLHLWEMLRLKLAGDELVQIRCVIGDFGVKKGVMETNALVFDTSVTRIHGSGTVDLGKETLDLTLVPDTKITTAVALPSPIYIRGTFSDPEPSIDPARVAARGLGAVALGFINPLLALIPLIETGPGMDSQCGRLIQEAKAARG
ncbi:AsmA family protein [Aromatoleum sp.]|uniref:AsmA family protein n=1 Tax=Aromatoleum sp. TaxID=2307007 RepID=UPI002FC726AF